MELTFIVDSHKAAMSLEGHITRFSITHGNPNELPEIELEMYATKYSVSTKDPEITKVLKLPRSDGGCIRIGGATSFGLSAISEMGGKGCHAHLRFHVYGYYETYEDACAAEMENIMVKSK